jgi:hypothetical protein
MLIVYRKLRLVELRRMHALGMAIHHMLGRVTAFR